MVRFKKIIVENYKAISYAEITFESGIYKVVGNNLDDAYESNGASKSSLLQAIVLGLYNKDFTDVSLDSLSNRTTGIPYKVTVEFDVVSNGITQEVLVVNSRGLKKVIVSVDNKVVSPNTTTSLPMIEKMLGMGYMTFKLTHFITSATITQLTQNLSQPTLFNDILHIVELTDLDKKLLFLSKDIDSQLKEASSTLSTIQEQAKVLSIKSQYNPEELEEILEVTINNLDTLEEKYGGVNVTLENNLEISKNELVQVEQIITQTKLTLRSGVCSMCNTIILDKDTIQQLSKQLLDAESKYNTQSATYESLKSQYRILYKKYEDSKSEYLQTIAKLKEDLGIAKIVDSIKTTDSSPEDLLVLSNTVETLEQQALFVQTARKEIKSGKVIKGILDQFFSIVQIKVLEYSELINLAHFEIQIANDRLGMAILLKQNNIDVPIDTLSNGEKTRLSMLVLISMLDAMKIVSESETNYVVFDEASSSFDKSGILELSRLFTHLKNLGQSCFIITHGSEMDEVPYDRVLEVTKQNGKSTILIQEI